MQRNTNLASGQGKLVVWYADIDEAVQICLSKNNWSTFVDLGRGNCRM